MRREEAERMLGRFGSGCPETARVVAREYDELVVAAQEDGGGVATVVFRSKVRNRSRVVRLQWDDENGGGRWEVVTVTCVPLAAPETGEASRLLDVRSEEPMFHFAPGTGEASQEVDAGRPRRRGGLGAR